MTNNIKDYYQIDDEERPHHVLGTALDEIFAMLPTSSTPSASATMKMHADDIDDDSDSDYDYLLAVAAAALLENEQHAFASALSRASASGVRKASTAIRLMLDSGATKSVVRALRYLINQHREEIPVNSAAGVTYAEGLGDLRVLLGDLADSIIIQVPALAMSQCPVDILAVRQLVTLGFRMVLDRDEPHLLAPPSGPTRARRKLPLEYDADAGLYFIDGDVILDLDDEHAHAVVNDGMDAFADVCALLDVAAPDLICNAEELLQRYHERLGHPSFDVLRKLVETTYGLKVKGPFQLAPCKVCDAIKVEKDSFATHIDKEPIKCEAGEHAHTDMHGPIKVPSLSHKGGGGNFYWLSMIDEKTGFSHIYFMKQRDTRTITSNFIYVLSKRWGARSKCSTATRTASSSVRDSAPFARTTTSASRILRRTHLWATASLRFLTFRSSSRSSSRAWQ